MNKTDFRLLTTELQPWKLNLFNINGFTINQKFRVTKRKKQEKNE